MTTADKDIYLLTAHLACRQSRMNRNLNDVLATHLHYYPVVAKLPKLA